MKTSVRVSVISVAAIVAAIGCGGQVTNEQEAATSGEVPTAPEEVDGGASPQPASDGGGGPRPGGGCDHVSGRWAGTWHESTGLRGTWEFDWQADASGALSGSGIVEGECPETEIEGQLDGCSISFGYLTDCNIEFTGVVSGDAVDGTFRVPRAYEGDWHGAKL